MPQIRFGLNLKIALFSAVLIVFAVAVSGWFAWGHARSQILDSTHDELRTLVAALSASIDGRQHESIRRLPPGKEVIGWEEFQKLRGQFRFLRGFIAGPQADQTRIFTLRPTADFETSRELEYVVMTELDPGGDYPIGRRIAAEPHHLEALRGEIIVIRGDAGSGPDLRGAGPIRNPDGSVVGIVTVDRYMKSLAAKYGLAGRQLAWTALLTILVGILLAFLFSRRISEPLVEIAEAAEKLGDGEVNHTPGARRSDEIGSLARSFNAMADRMKVTQSRLSSAVEASASAIIVLNTRGVIEYANPAFLALTGLPNREVLGARFDFFLREEDEGTTSYDEIWEAVQSGESWQGEIRPRNADGPDAWLRLSLSPVRADDGEVTHYIAVGENISALIDAKRELEYMALYDQITGLPNRQLLRDRLAHATHELDRRRGMLAVIYLDLDRFKRINDTFGHESGDTVIRQIALRLQSELRKEDTVARMGGDEFAMICMGLKMENDATVVAQKIANAVSVPIKVFTYEIIVTASMGVSIAPADSLDPTTLLKNADLAMYKAKESGRNNFQFYTDELNYEAVKRMFLESEVRRSIEQEHFIPYYQPQVDMATRRITGVETLIRWDHPDKGLIPPDEFIPITEDTGQVIELGNFILARACREAQEWRLATGDDIKVAVNLSARQFRDRKLLDTVRRTLDETGLPAHLLELEITETALMDNVAAVISILRQLKELGITVAIDDFGTGYSSLSYLKKFPIDILKIDRSFVKDIPGDTNDMEISAAIIAIAKKLRLEVVAEGVETEEQYEFLKRNECDIGQGYLFGKPMPSAELAILIGASEPVT